MAKTFRCEHCQQTFTTTEAWSDDKAASEYRQNFANESAAAVPFSVVCDSCSKPIQEWADSLSPEARETMLQEERERIRKMVNWLAGTSQSAATSMQHYDRFEASDSRIQELERAVADLKQQVLTLADATAEFTKVMTELIQRSLQP